VEGFVKGDVVVVPFPFTDLSAAKRRPALVIAALPGNDLILCQITNQTVRDGFAIPLSDDDFARGGLRKPSNVRPNRLFTADRELVVGIVGQVNQSTMRSVIDAIVRILEA
jgi:mRNA interferase MazF